MCLHEEIQSLKHFSKTAADIYKMTGTDENIKFCH